MPTRNPIREECFVFMTELEFHYDLRRLSAIWAARANTCSRCSAPPYNPCLNLTELHRGNKRPTRWPHDERVDWAKLLDALKKRVGK